ncbi:MAG: cysteine desulfurase, partial [Bacteroidales bacterium]
MEKIYLDYNASTPVHPEVTDSIKPFLDICFGNPSGSHWSGTEARKAVEEARYKVSSLLGSQPDEILFTSGGTESNNLAIKGYALAHKKKGNHIITSQIEHPAVTEVCRYLELHGFTVDYLPVDEYGMVNVRQLEDMIMPRTILITIMHANNEVGTIQPIEEISVAARKSGIAFHTDAAQTIGKIPVNVRDLGVDLLSVAGHKFYAPKGIGALYIRKGTELEKLIHGANHEMNLRAGTESVPLIVGLGKACEIAGRDLSGNTDHMRSTRSRLEDRLRERLPAIRINGHPEQRL